jgi:hypothetical protein
MYLYGALLCGFAVVLRHIHPGQARTNSGDETMRRTKKEAEMACDTSLMVAVDLFPDCGVASATLKVIVAAVGLTRGAVYWHSREKLDPLLALNDRETMRRADMPAGLVSSPSWGSRTDGENG